MKPSSRTLTKSARKRKPGVASLLDDQEMTLWSQIQHLRKVKKEIELAIQSLTSLLPEKEPAKHGSFFVLDPKTGKRVEVKV